MSFWHVSPRTGHSESIDQTAIWPAAGCAVHTWQQKKKKEKKKKKKKGIA